MDAKFTELVEQLNGLDFKRVCTAAISCTLGTRPPMSSKALYIVRRRPARAAREQRLVQDLRLGPGCLPVPRQLHPYALLLL